MSAWGQRQSAGAGGDAIRAVDHVQLPLPLGGSAQARVFYERLLGLRELRDPTLDRPGALHYALGWGRLDLSEGIYAGVAPQAHLALRVVGLATIVRRLRQAGVAVDDSPMLDAERAFVVDPFGNRLELIEPARNPELESFHVSDIRISV
jgi:catechol 2,3-dioxygenase-like lactoylglutathione lyase family enzyme